MRRRWRRSRAPTPSSASIRADEAGTRAHVRPRDRHASLKPFLDAAPFATARRRATGIGATWRGNWRSTRRRPWLLAVAMMRHGDKLASYRVLGEALASLLDRPLAAAGRGRRRRRAPQVDAALAPLGARVVYAG